MTNGWNQKIRSSFRDVFRRNRDEQELDAEMRFDLEERTRAYVAAGMKSDEARYRAMKEFGSVALAKEECRDARGAVWFEQLSQDLRFGVRSLRKNPGFTSVCVLTLALGIGANTAIFSLVNAVLLKPLPFPDPNQLVMVFATDAKRGGTEDVATYPDFADWRAQAKSFTGLGAFTTRSVIISAPDHAESVPAAQVTPGFFETLGVAPVLGRGFRDGENKPGARPVAILSDSFWRNQFSARSDIVGQSVRIVVSSGPNAGKGDSYTVVGVLPPGFSLTPDKERLIYTPLLEDANRGHGFLRVVGRLRNRAPIAQAQAEMNVITEQLAKQYPKYDQGVGTNIEPMRQALTGNVRPGLFIFLGVVGLVLLVACANVANLVLARGAARQKELSVRAALGAGRGRLARQILTESLVLSMIGGVAGLVLGAWVSQGLAGMLVRDLNFPGIDRVHLDYRVALFTLVLSFFTGIAFGLAPAFASTSNDLNETLRESGRSASMGVKGRRLRSMLVIAETALALVLLAGAGVLLKSLLVLRSTAPGFDTSNLAVVDFLLPQDRYADSRARNAFFTDLLSRFSHFPGERSAALVADLPLSGGSDSLGFHIMGRPDPAPDVSFKAGFNVASQGYFRTMSVPIRMGREFTADDTFESPSVIVINETAAREFWPNQNPIGQQINTGVKGANGALIIFTVVGVTSDLHEIDLGEAPKPMIYLDYSQPSPNWPWLTLVVRTNSDSANALPGIKSLAESIDRNVPVTVVRTMDDVLSSSIAQPRVYAALLGAFALLALVLAAVGLYGVVSYAATQRTHEIGIRIALGAGRSSVLGLVLRQGLGLATIGAAIGLLCSIGVNQALVHIVPSVQPGDPLTLTLVAALLLGVAVAASYVPAWKATRIDPIIALRNE